jgi:hypothetical protein
VLSIVGDIDSSNYEQLDRIAFQEIKDGVQYLLIDLAGVQLMSSAALRSMTGIFEKLRSLSMDGSDEEMHKGINAGTYKSPYLETMQAIQGRVGNLENRRFRHARGNSQRLECCHRLFLGMIKHGF